jgi:hypothetical protein
MRVALLLVPLAGCIRFHLPDTETGAADDTGDAPLAVPEVVWGDLHNHTNLSYDGCEDSDNLCMPDGTLPGEMTFARAAANGLGFAAITDHAEFTGYERPAEGIDLDVWEQTRALVQAADGGAAFGVMGFEWTSACTDQTSEYIPTHRTVLIEDTGACAAWRIPSCHESGTIIFGEQVYHYSELEPAIAPGDLQDRLDAVPLLDGCADSRYVAFFHHTAQDRPAAVDWASPETDIAGDTVAEIASEHGSSECDTTNGVPEGCDWNLSAEHHVDAGSIQYALQNGHKLGFVGGTDNHEDDPGSVANGAGKVRDLQATDADPTPWHDQYTNGTLTGAIVERDGFDRSDLFDVLEARHTVVASWPAADLVVYATGADGVRYLPGDDIPTAAEPLAITATLGDPTVTTWSAELVDPFGAVSTDLAAVTIPAGDARYVRFRVMIGDVEHRVFASPFFAQ